MKELNEILEKIEALQAARKENENRRPADGVFSEAWDKARKANKDGDKETEEAAHKEMEKIHKATEAYTTKEKELESLVKIYKENYKYLALEKVRPVVETTIKKFEGKQAGPKTKEKINEAIEKEVNIDGVKIYVHSNYYDTKALKFDVHFMKLSMYNEDATINIYDVLNANKITVTEKTVFSNCPQFKFIENPVEFLKINRAKREEINKKRLELLELVEAYNKEQPAAFQSMDSVKIYQNNFGIY